MAYLEVPGARLYYEVAGQGDHTLFFIPAGICDTRMWQPQMTAFAREYRCITFDPRGYGQTTMTDGQPYSNREDIAAILDHLAVSQAALIGCSRGGQIALDFTLEFPARVAGVVPVCSGLPGLDFEPPEEDMAIFAEMEALEAHGDIEQLIEREIDVFVVGFHRMRDQVEPALIDRVRVMQQANAAHATMNEQHKPIILQPLAVDRLNAITVPALVVIGLEDDAYALAAAHRMVADIPDAELVSFDNTAHLPSLERPERFNAALRAFLRRLWPQP